MLSDAARTADASRNETTDPLPGAGVIAEVITSDGAIQNITPGTLGWNDESTPTTDAYLKVVNKSGSTLGNYSNTTLRSIRELICQKKFMSSLFVNAKI